MYRIVIPLLCTAATALSGCADGAARLLHQPVAEPEPEPSLVALVVNGAPRMIIRACQQNNQYLEIEDELAWTYSLDGLTNPSAGSVGGEYGDTAATLAVTDDRGVTETIAPVELGHEAGRDVHRAFLSERTPPLDISITVGPALAGLPLCGE